MILISSLIILILVCGFLGMRKKTKTPNDLQLVPVSSHYNYSVFKRPINGDRSSLILISEGNTIDELGYQIYKSHISDLDKIDILIRDNKTGESMKVVKDGDSESMIGVCHPEMGHIGYLHFINIES